MIVRPQLHWFRLLFIWRGSVLPYLASRLLLVLAVSIASVLSRGWWMSEHGNSALSIPPFTLMGIALAIFLGFRNSVSYERFWEARKQWGALLIASRSLARQIASFACADSQLQKQVARSLAGFVYALKHQLRGSDAASDLACRLDPYTCERLARGHNAPSLVLLSLAQDLSAAHRAGVLTDLQLQSIDQNLHRLTEAAGACERIVSTPIPFTYRILMNRTVMIYCLLLPIGLSTSIGWLTPLIASFVAYTYLALDIIGEEIEEPFGTAPNDLPLAALCHTIEVSVCELLGETPRSLPPPVINFVVT